MTNRQSPERYGWRVVGVCFLTALYTGGVVFFGFTTLLEPLANQFGWSYAQISIVPSLQGVIGAVTAPFVGFLIDRIGSRRLIFGGVIVGGIGLVLLSRVTSLGMFYATSILIAIGMSACSSTAILTAVVKWFRRKIALATGIVASGFASGGLLVPMVAALVDRFHWQTAMVVLGLGMLVILLPLSLLIRHDPEKFDYLAEDGARNQRGFNRSFPSLKYNEEGITAKQALRSRIFWHIAISMMFQFMVINAVQIHIMPYLSTVGIARSSSSLIVSAITVASVCSRLGFGWVGDRFQRRGATAATFVLTSLGMLFFAYAASSRASLLIPFSVLFGLGWGGQVTMLSILLNDYFGRSRFGTIYGFTFAVMQTGGVIGVPLAGWVFDTWGSYQGIWLVFAGLALASGVIIAITPPVKEILRTTSNSNGKLGII